MTPACYMKHVNSTSSALDTPLDAALDDCDTLGFRECREVARSVDAVVLSGIDASNRSVAVKMFRSGEDLSSDQEFWDKVQEYSEVRHRHLVELHEIDPSRALIVTELLAGDWGQAIVSGPLPVSTVAAIGRQALEGLRQLHKHGLIHGRVSPRTLLHDATGATTKLAFPDWYRGGAGFPLPDPTDRHVAPEILDLAEFGAPDASLDLYCLGTTLIELLMGPEYDLYCYSDTGGAATRDLARAWQSWHANPDAVFPRLSQMRRDMPAELAAVIDRLVAKHTADRFATAAEALEEFPVCGESKTAESVGVRASSAADAKKAKSATPFRPRMKTKSQRWRKLVLFGMLLVLGVLCLALLFTRADDDALLDDLRIGEASMTVQSSEPLRGFSLTVKREQSAGLGDKPDLEVFMQAAGEPLEIHRWTLDDPSALRIRVPELKDNKIDLTIRGNDIGTFDWSIQSDFYADKVGEIEVKEVSDRLDEPSRKGRPTPVVLEPRDKKVKIKISRKDGTQFPVNGSAEGLRIKIDQEEEFAPGKGGLTISEATKCYELTHPMKIGKRKITISCPDYEKAEHDFDVSSTQPDKPVCVELVALKHPVELQLKGVDGRQTQDLLTKAKVVVAGTNADSTVKQSVTLTDALASGLQLETGSYNIELAGLSDELECLPITHEVRGGESTCKLRIVSTKRRLTITVEPSDATMRIVSYEPDRGGADIKPVGHGVRHEFLVAKDLRTVTIEISHHSGEFKTQQRVVNLGGGIGTNDSLDPRPHDEVVRLKPLPIHLTTFVNLTPSEVLNIKLEHRDTKKISEFKLGDRHRIPLFEGVYLLEGTSDSNPRLKKEIEVDESGPVNIFPREN